MKNPLRILMSWLTQAKAETPDPVLEQVRSTQLAIRESFRSDLSDLSADEDDGAVISEEEWDIQERTRKRVEAIRESRDKGFVVREHTGSGVGDGVREGASLDWDIATSETMAVVNDKLSVQKMAWFERGAHHMGSSAIPLLPKPEDTWLAGCGRLIRESGCEWIEAMVSGGIIRPKVESGSRMTLEVLPLDVSVLVEFIFVPHARVRFSLGEREFSNAKELEAWLRSSINAA